MLPSTPGSGSSARSPTRSPGCSPPLGLAGAAVVVILIGVLHFLPETAGISPISRTISEYALTDVGWMFNLGVLSLAAGSLAIFAAVVRAGLARPGSVGIWLGGCWSAALTVIVLFPKHNWAVGPSANGQIHRAASIVAFLCLPVAVLLLTRRRGVPRRDHPIAARFAWWLAVASLAWFVPIVGALALSLGDPHAVVAGDPVGPGGTRTGDV